MEVGCFYSVSGTPSKLAKPFLTAEPIPFGISYIATVLSNAGHSVRMFVGDSVTTPEAMIGTYLHDAKPRVFCFTAVSTQYPIVRTFARYIKSIDPGILIAIGGSHTTLMPEDVIKDDCFDVICVGEGETAMLTLAGRVEAGEPWGEIANLWIRDPETGEVIKTPPQSFNVQLDELPHIDRKMWDSWITFPDRNVPVLVGRGCPFRCTYCSNHKLQAIAPGKYVRFRSPENVIAEVESLRALYPDMRTVYLEIETITSNMRYAMTFFEALRDYNRKFDKGEKIKFGINCTVTTALISKTDRFQAFAKLLKDANVIFANVGLESGSQRVRDEVLRRPKYSNDSFKEFVRVMKENGLDVNVFVLMGVPGETLEDFKETVAVCRTTQPTSIYLSIFYPYPGTDLHDVAMAHRMVPDGLRDNPIVAERTRVYIELKDFPKWRVQFEYFFFWFRVYGGHRPFMQVAARTVVGILQSFPWLYALHRSAVSNSRVLQALRQRLSMKSSSFSK